MQSPCAVRMHTQHADTHHGEVLDLDAADPLAAALDHVLAPACMQADRQADAVTACAHRHGVYERYHQRWAGHSQARVRRRERCHSGPSAPSSRTLAPAACKRMRPPRPRPPPPRRGGRVHGPACTAGCRSSSGAQPAQACMPRHAPVRDGHVAQVIDGGDVAGAEPVVGVDGGLLRLKVGTDGGWAAHLRRAPPDGKQLLDLGRAATFSPPLYASAREAQDFAVHADAAPLNMRWFHSMATGWALGLASTCLVACAAGRLHVHGPWAATWGMRVCAQGQEACARAPAGGPWPRRRVAAAGPRRPRCACRTARAAGPGAPCPPQCPARHRTTPHL